MSAIQETPKKDFYVHRGAPDPIIVRYRAANNLIAFNGSLKFTYVTPTGTTTLGVGSGITLSTDEAVSNARATIQMTVAQSRLIPPGGLTTYEIQRDDGGREHVFLMGKLIGEGGENTDV